MRDGGILKICQLINTAVTTGDMPKPQLDVVGTSYYSYVQTGITRLYAAIGVNHRYDFVVRCWNLPSLPAEAQYVVLEDGSQFRVDVWQYIVDEDAIDLTLVRMDELYDVIGEDTDGEG